MIEDILYKNLTELDYLSKKELKNHVKDFTIAKIVTKNYVKFIYKDIEYYIDTNRYLNIKVQYLYTDDFNSLYRLINNDDELSRIYRINGDIINVTSFEDFHKKVLQHKKVQIIT